MRFFIVLILLLSNTNVMELMGQSNFWQKTDEMNLRSTQGKRQIIPSKYEVYTFDYPAFIKFISSKSKEISAGVTIKIPLPEGLTTFKMEETPVFDAELSNKYPGFTSFTGKSIDISGYTLKMSVSPFGINAMIMHDELGTIFVDPYTQHNQTEYIVYHKKDFRKKTGNFTCGVSSDHLDLGLEREDFVDIETTTLRAGDCVLRSYRLALACTGEYASYHGGTKEKVLAAYNNTMTRVNGVYEKEVAITMKLIGNTDQLIFLNAQSDPYTNDEGSIMLDENQTTVNNIIGISNYDIGHVFSTAGGGIAQLRSPCTASKARGVTGQSNPVGDPFDIDYVAHEMGHQFGANHTQNNSCQRNSTTAVEPGSASTIMGYAGICSPNVQSNSHANFHAVSLGEIANFIVAGNGNTCATRIEINNQKPQISLPSNSYTIPISTSFVLTATAEDADMDELTYCWEQMNNQTATMPPVATSTAGPSFRALPPDISPSRFFPDLQRRYSQWEVLPSVSRTMNFRCTVRDNNPLGGCTDEANVQVMTNNQAGPFVVTSPNTSSVNWKVGSPQTVTWNVANTEKAPINCSLVNIFLSTDGGKTYPHLVAEKVPNIGSYDITTPSLPTNMARIMVISDGNIFYDVSNANFNITATFAIAVSPSYVELCNQSRIDINLSLTKLDNANQNITLSLDNPPSGLQFTFTPQVVALPGTSILSILNPQSLPIGASSIKIIATVGTEKVVSNITIFKALTTLVSVSNISPINYAINVPTELVILEWTSIPGINKYLVELSENPSFKENVTALEIETTSLGTTLKTGSIYYWRVKPISPCLNNDFGPTYSFKTAGGNDQDGILLKNEVLLISRNESGIINDQKIDFASFDNDLSNIIITSLPSNGLLLLDNIVLQIGDKVSKSSLLNNLLVYKHNGNTAESDVFTFDIIDDLNRWLPGQIFNIKIRQSTLGGAAFVENELLCFGDQAGSIIVEGYGGTPPYQYSLDNLVYQNSNEFENLISGTYNLYIKDAQNVVKTTNVVSIKSPSEINIGAEVINYDIILTLSGGTGNLLYSLDDISYELGNIISDPGNGDYVIYVKDDNGCKDSLVATINIPTLNATSELTKDVICPGDFANILASPQGGIEPYTYSLNGLDFQSAPTFNVGSGNYVIYVKDAGSKVFITDTLKTTQINDFAVNFSQNGFVFTFDISGGTPPYLIGRNITNLLAENVITFPGNGTFKVYVRDANECSYEFNVSINIFSSVSRTVRNTTCYGLSNGFLRLSPSNGSSPYLYQLNQGDFTTQREWNNLSAGEYTFAVIDSKSDTVKGNITITEPDSLIVNLAISNNNLTITTTGGTPPYRHSLDGGDVFLSANVFTELPLGTYNIIVKDDNDCFSTEQIITLTSANDLHENQNIVLTPNPNEGYFTVASDIMLDPNAEVSIIDMLGRHINVNAIKSQNSNEMQIDMMQVPSGVYLMIIKSNDKQWSAKMVKM